jgi:hypothetical protein
LRNLTANHGELVTQDRDLDVLVVRRRTDTEETKQLSDDQEGDGGTHRTIVADLHHCWS